MNGISHGIILLVTRVSFGDRISHMKTCEHIKKANEYTRAHPSYVSNRRPHLHRRDLVNKQPSRMVKNTKELRSLGRHTLRM